MSRTPVITTDFYDTASVKYTATRRIDASPDEVFAALADTPRWSEWFPMISAAEWQSPEPHGVGSRRRVKVGGGWINEEFIVWEPGRRWGFRALSLPIPAVRALAELVELTPDGDGTSVTYGIYVEPLPLMGPFSRLVRGGVEKGVGDGLKGLDRYLASQK